MSTPPAIYVLDAYGTLFDVHSAVARHRDEIGPEADRLSLIWRTKQLEYSWTRTLMGRYRDFWTLTADALDFAAASTGVRLPLETRDRLLGAYETLDVYPEVPAVLKALRARGARTAILTNAPAAMASAAAGSAGIADLLDAVLSVDPLSLYKTDPRAYGLVNERFGVEAEAVAFQSSNRWDIAGAHAFGFRTVWINRSAAPDEYLDLPADRVLPDLSGLL